MGIHKAATIDWQDPIPTDREILERRLASSSTRETDVVFCHDAPRHSHASRKCVSENIFASMPPRVQDLSVRHRLDVVSAGLYTTSPSHRRDAKRRFRIPFGGVEDNILVTISSNQLGEMGILDIFGTHLPRNSHSQSPTFFFLRTTQQASKPILLSLSCK